ncbi:MAG: ribosome-associated translation inhibitor RaiA [Paracoccaceae bacterium]|nr:ribosome-associated translation inhibitor RaiA [Paracoccaceae bacterium]
MNVHINGKQVKIGKSLIFYAENQLVQVSKKYLLRPVTANITFTKEKYEYKCEAFLHLPSGLTAYCTGSANQIYKCYHQTITRLEKILRRHKRKIRNRSTNK